MTNKELLEKIARLEAELAEVKEKAEAMKKGADGGLFKPEDGEKYWFASGSRGVYESRWENHPIDHDRYAIGNCFPTKQATEDAIRVLKLIQKARESQNGFVPDWGNAVQDKYSLIFESVDNDVYVTSDQLITMAPIFGYWGVRLACGQFIDENHKELIWFFTEYQR